ncbi:beta-1,3-galactosyltransferase 1 [Tribolium castaneum]|uniref:Hexosyltransferase n=1 Tax=Tribolium castaneum TaxID=7070 RepID=A0A139WEW9_TRICA|nr:PREDICTED: beta-1,3-galactosyltransferase 1-like [Tribolium castaneum]XP_015837441.1 PREDICTED: beta-1,3-galactosyltransferase 1-like [Tribolium castaneum]XP_972758.2 PREDICTED: beta-1,3-galactosyltransferase 1-like [Tribolium castaneum]KYB26486.1 Beta-1,3-galactosyltransferase brn-like Protein [Tribolium castaneum]|eukprot:XP_015837440.1 PREDICTED: beta-1,3-galactosyltransferase 1-like [Tribolium castaneum]
MSIRRRFYILCICFAISTGLSLLVYGYFFAGSSDLDINMSRNMNDYINQRLPPIIRPKKMCSEKKFLLVIVSSRPKDVDLRKAIRETWGQKHNNVTFYFIFGQSKKKAKKYQAILEEERALYNDIIQERFIDSYNNLTLKSTFMLKVVNRYCKNSFKYLMKADDDVFVNLPRVLHMLSNRKTHENVILGRLRRGWPIRDTYSKWYVPYEWYPEQEYPANVCGASYIMSFDVARKLYDCALSTPLVHMEDIFLTGICGEKMNVLRENNYMFTCNNRHFHFCYYKNYFTLHYYSAIDMVNAWEMLHNHFCDYYLKFDVRKPWAFLFNFLF